MPLDSEDEAVFPTFNAFNNSIFCCGIRDQALARILDRLMMGSIDFEDFAPHDPMKFRLGEDVDGMAALYFWGRLLMS